jgi:hypothetical protein
MHHRTKPAQSVARSYLPAAAAGLVFLATLLFNAFTYAALASHAEIGNAFRMAIQHNSPFIEGYVWLGDQLRGLPGLSAWGDSTANAAAEPLIDRIRPHPRGAAAVFFGESKSPAHGRMLWAQRMLPLFAIIAAILWARRQKPVHLRNRLRA